MLVQDAGEVPDEHELAEVLRTHAATTAEVCALCGDLQVLGRSEFKALLRWRMKVRGDVAKAAAAAQKAGDGAAVRPVQGFPPLVFCCTSATSPVLVHGHCGCFGVSG
jgi:hypothetical protein